jgi:hypothetical protein
VVCVERFGGVRRLIRIRSASALRLAAPRPPAPSSPATTYVAASTTRITARLTAKTSISPVDAGSIATAATPAGTLAARNTSRCAGRSAPWRL